MQTESMNKSSEIVVGPYWRRIKTKMVCWLLACEERTLRRWEKEFGDPFAPVRRTKKGNIYWLGQARIMASVMDGREKPENGAAIWLRMQQNDVDETYRDAGDKTRGRK